MYLENLYNIIQILILRCKHLSLVNLSAIKFHYNKNITQDVKIIIKEIKKNGYIVIPNYFSKQICNEIIKDIDLHLSIKSDRIWKDEEDSDFRIYGANFIKNQNIYKFFCDEKILLIVENYMKLKIENAFTMAAKIVFNDRNKGSGGGWHRDSINPSVKAMMYLNDVDEKNGPLQIIEKSNVITNILKDHKAIRKNKFTDTRFSNDEIIKIINSRNANIITINAKAGAIIIFDGSYIHRGCPILEKNRYALTNYYSSKLRVEREKEAVKSFLLQ
jgi:hypothetical protein